MVRAKLYLFISTEIQFSLPVALSLAFVLPSLSLSLFLMSVAAAGKL